MRWIALVLVLVGCGVTGPEVPTIELSLAESAIGVTFYADPQPADSVFYRMEYLYQGEWNAIVGTGHGFTYHALVWTADVNVTALFIAWTPDVAPDSIWFKHES